MGVRWSHIGNRKVRNAKKVTREYMGEEIVLDSKLEAYLFDMLIFYNIEFELKPSFVLQPAFKYDGKSFRAITYTADFRVNDDIIDVKGYPNDVFPLKKKMFIFNYSISQGLNLVILKSKKQINEYVRSRLEGM